MASEDDEIAKAKMDKTQYVVELTAEDSDTTDISLMFSEEVNNLLSQLENPEKLDVDTRISVMTKLISLQSAMILQQGNMIKQYEKYVTMNHFDEIDNLSSIVDDTIASEEVCSKVFSALHDLIKSPINMEPDHDDVRSIISENFSNSESKSNISESSAPSLDASEQVSTKNRNQNVAKALQLLGDTRLIAPKALKVLGLEMTAEEERTLYGLENKDNLVESLKLFSETSGEEGKEIFKPSFEASAKGVLTPRGINRRKSVNLGSNIELQNLDENGKMLQPISNTNAFKVNVVYTSPLEKMKKFLKSEDTQRHQRPSIDLEIMKKESLMKTKWKNDNAKVVKLTGEVMLASAKIQKIMGTGMTIDQIKKQKEAEADPRNSLNQKPEQLAKMKMRYTAPGTPVQSKALKLTGEPMLAGEKAVRVLGDDTIGDETARRSSQEKFKMPEISMEMQKKYSAPNERVKNAKVLGMMGETLLAGEKAKKLLGDGEDDEKVRKASQDKFVNPEISMETQMRYSAPSERVKNAKVLEMMGETLLAGEKAKKMLGSGENDNKARALADDEVIEISMETQMKYSAPDRVDGKAMKLLGEKMLGGHKASKMLGEDDDEKARKLALAENAGVEIDVDMIKRVSLDNAKVKTQNSGKQDKLVAMLGETMLAGSKAEKMLGDGGLSRKQMEAMQKSDAKEAALKQKDIEKHGPLLSNEMKEALKVLKEVEAKHEDPLSPSHSVPITPTSVVSSVLGLGGSHKSFGSAKRRSGFLIDKTSITGSDELDELSPTNSSSSTSSSAALHHKTSSAGSVKLMDTLDEVEK